MSYEPDLINGLNIRMSSESVADDGTLTIATAKAGFGLASIGDNQEYALFSFSAVATVTLISNSANTVNTDIDTKFCIYPNGTSVIIKNRLGSSLTVRYVIWYS